MNKRIDAHQHLWDPAKFSFSWMKDLPTLRTLHGIAEYRRATEGIDIAGSIYVDTDVDEVDLSREAAWIFDLADDPANRILGIVASARLEKENCFEHLREYFSHPKLRGFRRVLHTQDDSIFNDPTFLRNLASLEGCDWSIDLCVQARQLPLALALVKRFPGHSFILDHCGCPDVRRGVFEPWRTDLEGLAHQRNVACKVSGLVAYADACACSKMEIGPFVEETIHSFGWDRVLWGSDWPMCTLTCSLGRWHDIASCIIQTAAPDEQAAFFGENAKRIYRLDEPAK